MNSPSNESNPPGQSPGPFPPPEPGQDLAQWLHEQAGPDDVTHRVMRFHELLWELTPRVYMVRLIVGLNVAVFAVMLVMGAGLLMPPVDRLLEFGANYGPKTLGGEPWRLVTSMFVHIGAIHLLFNMWALWAAGNLLERLVGNLGFAALYLTAGIAGSVASIFWNPGLVSAGASGAVFGVFGGLIGYLLFRRDTVPLAMLSAIRNSAVTFVLYNIIFGAVAQGIDNAAHLGGLAAGFLAGMVMSQPLQLEALRGRLWRNLVVAAAGTALFTSIVVSPPAAPPDFFEELSQLDRIQTATREALNAASGKAKEGKLSNAEFIEILAREVIPPWQEATVRLEAIQGLPESQMEAISRCAKYMHAKGEAWQLLVEGIRENDAGKLARSRERAQAAEAIAKQFSEEAQKRPARRLPF